jgi:hypothetical protein
MGLLHYLGITDIGERLIRSETIFEET